jgi:hypothetical protein
MCPHRFDKPWPPLKASLYSSQTTDNKI